jgi:hypothetical protein
MAKIWKSCEELPISIPGARPPPQFQACVLKPAAPKGHSLPFIILPTGSSSLSLLFKRDILGSSTRTFRHQLLNLSASMEMMEV